MARSIGLAPRQRPNPFPRPKEAPGRAVGEKDAYLRPPLAVVPQPRSQYHGCLPHNRLHAPKIFNWFVQEVANNRRAGDADKEKALLAEVFKLLGNSAYGKLIEAVERQTRTLYTKDEGEVDKQLRSAWFEGVEAIGDVYKIECRKPKVKINRPFQAGIVVYQLAKLSMLEFYYDFLEHFLDRRDFELIQMDTDSMYFALAYNKLEEAIKPELRKNFEQKKKEWLSWDKGSNREPGLFKLEKEGTRAIALCSKCYFVEDEADGQAKMSAKGVNKKQNELRWVRYERTLEG